MKITVSTRWLIIFACLVLGIYGFFSYLGIHSYLTVDFLKKNRIILCTWVRNYYIAAVLIYIGLYLLESLLFLPFSAFLSLTSGFLFGFIPGALYTLVGATLGGIAAYVCARDIWGIYFRKKYIRVFKRFNAQVQQYGASFLIGLRLIPVVPFFVVNILAGLVEIPLVLFVWTTIIGILPSTLLYAYAGNQLNTIHSLHEVLNKRTLIIFFLLGLGAFLPVIFKRFKNMYKLPL